MNHDKADLAKECQACNGKESDLSMDFIRKISAVLSGWSWWNPAPRGIHKRSKSSRIFVLSTLYHCNKKNLYICNNNLKALLLILIMCGSKEFFNNRYNLIFYDSFSFIVHVIFKKSNILNRFPYFWRFVILFIDLLILLLIPNDENNLSFYTNTSYKIINFKKS